MSPQNKHIYPNGTPFLMTPAPGTAFKNILDLRCVNASVNPIYDQNENMSANKLPYPKHNLQFYQTSYSLTLFFTKYWLTISPTIQLTSISNPKCHTLINLLNWYSPNMAGRYRQNGFPKLNPANKYPDMQVGDQGQIMKYRQLTRMGKNFCSKYPAKAADINNKGSQLIPFLYLTPNSTTYNNLIVLGSLSITIFCQNVFGYYFNELGFAFYNYC